MTKHYRFTNDLKRCYDNEGNEFFTAPFKIENPQDVIRYEATWAQVKKLRFGGGNTNQRYILIPTDNEALARYQWSEISTEHSRAFVKNRCMLPGKRKLFTRCPDTVSCASCPYGRTTWDRQPNTISWEMEHDENAFDPADESVDVQTQAETKVALEELQAKMDAHDPRIMRAIDLRVRHGFSIKEIAEEFGVSPSRVYQLLNQAVEIGRKYQKEI